MGLTLCYELTLPGDTDVADVRARLRALWGFAATVGFDHVLWPSEYTRDELAGRPVRHDIVHLIARGTCGGNPEFPGALPFESCAIAFPIAVGAQCEPALFGFVRPGSRNDGGKPEIDMHPGQWYWCCCCKTQYASLVSNDHFVKCHDGLVRVLDHAVKLGIGVHVEDDSGYWEHRSTEKLVARMVDMNRLIARFAGAMHDELGEGHRVKAPIFEHPEFEHLEMEGRESRGQADGDPG